ncbi:MAG: carboxypeptidase-like regulatory domain-containing protein [Gemmatimonadaceae bacterium]
MLISCVTMHRSAKRAFQTCVALWLCGSLSTHALSAQELRGSVSNADNTTPASGVVLVMLHATRDDSVIARTITSERGTFAFAAPKAMTVRLQALRIGFRPTLIGSFILVAGESQSVSVALTDTRIQLATFDINSKSKCDVKPDGALLVSQLFEQARTALTASIAPTSGMQATAQFNTFVRNEDRQGRLVGSIERSNDSGPTIRPFTSTSAASLAKTGYIVDREDGSVLYAPDANVIISESFVTQHCLFLVQGTGEQSELIGIGFRPAKLNTARVDVHGTLWLDRGTSNLRYLEYGYEPMHIDFQRLRVGGRVDYAKTENGLWFVSKWAIRLPRVSAAQMTSLARFGGMSRGQSSITGIQTVGGEVQDIRLDGHVLYASNGALRSGEQRGDITTVRASTMLERSSDTASTRVTDVVLAINDKVEVLSSAAGPPPVPKTPSDSRKALVYVTDVRGYPIAYATVVVNGGGARVTDSLGTLLVPAENDNTIQLVIRRIGFTAYSGTAHRTANDQPYHIKLGSLAQSLATVKINARRELNPLERTGFYERMMDVQRGAVVGEFYTPEQLDARPFNRLSLAIANSRHVSFRQSNHGILFLGRPTGREPEGCVMSIMIDGHQAQGVLNRLAGGRPVDELVDANQVMGIEIYPSAATTPMALLPQNGMGDCGVVAIWTGGRR